MSLRLTHVAIFSALLIGCGSLPVSQAVWTSTPETVTESAWTRDKDSGLEWLVTNDAEALYLRLGIKDRMRQMLARRAGITVYLDPNGSKNEDISIQYPFIPQPAGFDPREDMSMPTPALSTDLLWVRDEDRSVLNPHLERTGFAADFEQAFDGKMIFSLRVPLDSLAAGGTRDLQAVSIGIEFFNPERPGGGMDMSTGGRDGRSGGRAGGRTGGERNRPGAGAPGERTDLRQSGPVWFLAKFAIGE